MHYIVDVNIGCIMYNGWKKDDYFHIQICIEKVFVLADFLKIFKVCQKQFFYALEVFRTIGT